MQKGQEEVYLIDKMKIKSINPYTGKVMKEFDLLSKKEVDEKIKKSRKAFQAWKDVSIEERSRLVKEIAKVLRKNPKRYAKIITSEMGMPITSSTKSIEKCAWLCDYYSKNAKSFLKPETVKTEFKKSYIRFDPIGLAFIIMPWNYPFWQVFRQAVTSIIAGNVCLLKHASNVPQCALAIEKIFREAGIPKGVFTTLLIDSKTAMNIIDEDKVDAVSLTGSNFAGEKIGELSGKRIKPLVLELGGSDPFIVLSDADLVKAAKMATTSRFLNAGQSCISAKRIIVMKDVEKEFTKLFLENFKKLKLGDPMDESTNIGPLAKRSFVDDMEKLLKDAKSKGAVVESLCKKPKKGFFFVPTILSKTKKSMDVVKNEVFGPIAPIIVVNSEEEAISVANNTQYGLGSSIWTKDIKKGERLAREINSGFVGINDMTKSDPRLPFGGVKKSGLGRELSQYGLKQFVNIKTVVVK